MRRGVALLMAALAAAGVGLVLILGPDDQRFARGNEAERVAPPIVRPGRAPAPGDLSGPPPEVRAAAREWPLPHHDYANTRATSDSQIDSRTIGRLKLAWTSAVRGPAHWGAAASAPVIAGGVAYVQDLDSNLLALDVA